MLRCINKSLAAAIVLSFSAVLAAHGNLQFLSWNTYSKYQVFLEELKTVGQETFPGFPWSKRLDASKRQAVETVARVLSERMRDWSKWEIRKLSEHIVMLSEQYRFSPAFILSLIEVESRFRVDAISHRGAMGLMQVLPETGQDLAHQLAIKWDGERSLMDPHNNISMGVHYMDELRQKFKSPKYYIAAYNQGPNRVIRLIQSGEPVPMDYYEKVMQVSRRYSDTPIARF